ncbi:MAG: VWA domain-containing protein [Candidatus Sericytochromatia bacterium]
MQELFKGEKVSLNKISYSKNFIIDINYISPLDYDIDSTVLMLSSKNKLEEEDDFIFYNNPISNCKSVEIVESPNVKKKIIISLNNIPDKISRLMFVSTIDNGDEQDKRFNNIKDFNIKVSDNNQNLISYTIKDLTRETAVILIEIYKHNNEWKLQATGNGFNSGLSAILKEYGSEKVQVQDNEPINSIDNLQKVEIKHNIIEDQTINNRGVSLSKNPVGNIDFVKKHHERFNLAKKEVETIGLNNLKANVVLVMDISASMTFLFSKGVVQDTFDRILPLAMQFDNDGIIDVWLFDDKCINSKVSYTLMNRENYVKEEIEKKYPLGYGTQYAPVINSVASKYGNSNEITYVLFFTDGDCGDHTQTEKAIINSSNKPIFWKFVGLGGNKPRDPNKKGFFNKFISLSSGFSFLEKLDNLDGRFIDNADFFHIYKINEMSDIELYKNLLEELPQWLISAKTHNLL